MSSPNTALLTSDPQAAIVRDPLVVSPNTKVIDAIAQMSQSHATCNSSKVIYGQDDDIHRQARSSCVIVVDQDQVVGILTERDLVRLTVQYPSFQGIEVREVMTTAVIMLPQAELTDLLTAINLLQQHQIRHLPIVDEQKRLVGVATHETLRHLLQPTNLLKLRTVAEIMTADVVCAPPHSSILTVAQKMYSRGVSSVIIAESRMVESSGTICKVTDNTSEQQFSSNFHLNVFVPIGIVTERDLVQFQALGLSLTTYSAATVMSSPVFTVTPGDSLLVVQQLMQRHFVHRLVVTGKMGELLGIVTQSSLLKALNPLEIYKLTEILEQKVKGLESEKVLLLENRASVLEQEVKSSTKTLQTQARRAQLLLETATQIRSSLSLPAILETAVEKIRQIMDCDRVAVWQLESDSKTTIVVAESTSLSQSLLGERLQDNCYNQAIMDVYRQGYIRVIDDIYTTDISDCHRQLLTDLQIRAKVLVPLLSGKCLWGFLGITESQNPREWQPDELEFLQALSVQLAIALQQATIHAQLQTELQARQSAESRSRAIVEALPDLQLRVRRDGTCLDVIESRSPGSGMFLPIQSHISDVLPANLVARQLEVIATTLATRTVQVYEHQLEKNGVVTYEEIRIAPLGNADEVLVVVRDISHRKKAEMERLNSERRFRWAIEQAPFPIMIHAEDGEVLQISSTWTELTGYSLDEIPTTTAWAERAYGDRAAQAMERIRKKYDLTAKVDDGEFTITTSNGEQRIWSFSTSPIGTLPDGRRLVVSMAADVTQQKAVEQQLRKADSLYREAQRIAHVGNWEMDYNSNTLYWSDEKFRIFGLEPGAIAPTYEAFLSFVHPEDRALAHEEYLGHLRDRCPVNQVYRLLFPDGQIKYVQETYETQFAEDGTPLLTHGILHDITSLKQAEQEREQAKNALQQVLEGTAAVTGQAFFPELVQHIAQALSVSHVSLTEVVPNGFSTLALYSNGALQPTQLFSYDEVPSCVKSLAQGHCYYPDSLQSHYPNNQLFKELEAESYLGISLRNAANEPIGNLCIFHNQPLQDGEWATTLLKVFAVRAAAELERQQAITKLETLNRELEVRVAQRAEELQKLSQRLAVALRSGDLGYWEWQIDTGAVFWDERLFVLHGILQGDLTFETFMSTVHPEDVEPLERLAQRALAGDFNYENECGKACPYEAIYRALHPNGAIYYLKAYGSVLRDRHNQATGMLGVTFDITSIKRAEHQLRHQAQQERLMASITQRIRASLNLGEILHSVVRETRQILQSDRVLIYQVYPNGTGAAIAEDVVAGWPKLLDTVFPEEVFPVENYDRYVQGRTFALCDRNHQRHLVLPCLAKFLAEIQVRAKLVVPIVHDTVLWGLLIAHQCDQPREWQEVDITLMKRIAGQLAIAIQQARLFEQLQAELHERQKAQHLLTQRNQQLALTNEELARATRLKDEFLANMSHELRTPLNAILGMTESLQEKAYGEINDRQREALETVFQSGNHLLALINDILDLAKVESGQVELEYSTSSIHELCQSSLVFVKQQAYQKRIQTQLQIPTHLPELTLDERRIRQVLINLLSNAVKFTPEQGSILLRVSIEADVESAESNLPVLNHPAQDPPNATAHPVTATNTWVRFAVVDTGIGISPENIQKLFQPFVQIDSALNRQYAGTGLGLSLVKRLVELHGGEVGVYSQLGQGSEFWFKLPCQEGSSLERPSAIALPSSYNFESSGVDTSLTPYRILLAEDNPANIRTMAGYLQVKGYTVILAHNGEEAIAQAQAENPDVILMDIQMPGMDGLEAIRRIRHVPALATTPIIALTALAMESDRDKCLAAGANDYLAKPVRLRQLVTLVQQCLQQTDIHLSIPTQLN